MRTAVLGFAALSAALTQARAASHGRLRAATPETAYAHVSSGECVISDNVEIAQCTGHFVDEVEADGWGKLWASTGPSPADGAVAALACGCVTGYLSQHRMYQYWQNYVANEYGKAGPCDDLTAFVDAQMEYTAAVVRGDLDLPDHAPEGFLVSLKHVMSQFEGLAQGYALAARAIGSETLSRRELYMLNAVGDLEDLNGICDGSVSLSPAAAKDIGRLSDREVAGTALQEPVPQALKLTDCSGFVKVLPDKSDVVFGQATWRAYYAMLRTYHTFRLDYAPAGIVSFSASPGFLMSKDDFAVSQGKAQLAIFETTNSFFNRTRFNELLTPRSVLTWQRSAMAMQWATSGRQYTELMSFNQSGTYNNQWVVLDAKQFSAGDDELQADLLWVVELIPGLAHAADMTKTLETQGYWPSYNIPFFEDIYNISGYPAQEQARGNDFSYTNAPRARIFRRNTTDVAALHDLQLLMRYNRFQTDPLAGGDAILGA